MSSDESRESLIGRARQLVEAGQVAQALKALQQRLSREVFDSELWNFVGDLQVKLGQKSEGVEAYRRAAQLLLERGDLAQSIAAYERLLHTQPQDVAAQLCLAAIYRKQGQHNRAAASYELAAQALAAEGKLHESLAVVQVIVDMSPDNVARRVRLADQYARAHRTAEALRELSAAETFLRQAGRSEEAARVAGLLHQLERNPAAGKPPKPEAASSDGAPALQRRDRSIGIDSPGQRASGPTSLKGAPISKNEDAAGLIAEADSFLRLGLVDQAAEHLSAALVRNPFLRGLREPLVKLHVAQGKYQQAVGELWELLSNCPDRGQEIRYLRYLLRLDSQDQAARKRLSSLTDTLQVDEPDARSEAATPLFVAKVDGELRSALGIYRPLTDSATTSGIRVGDSQLSLPPPDAEAPSQGTMLPTEEAESPEPSAADSAAALVEGPLRPSAATRPGLAQMEAMAEEIALSSVSFREELAEIDRCVQAARYDDALGRLQVLAACYPHNQTVRAQLAEIEQAQRERTAQKDSSDPVPELEANLLVSTDLAAAMRALSPEELSSRSTPTLTSLLTRAQKSSTRSTLEVDMADIVEEPSLRPEAAAPPRHPPPPPPKSRRSLPGRAAAAAAVAFRKGVELREHGQSAQAIAEFTKVLDDPAQGARAALLLGLCLREQSRFSEALASFMRGVNMPAATEADLSELFYELGHTHELTHDLKEAVLFFQLSLGSSGGFRDAAARISTLQQFLRQSW